MSDTTTKIICPICESANCFESETDGAFSYLCMRCGSTTNTHFKDGSPQLEEALKKSPKIIQALKHKDPKTELVWIPSVINIPSRGMIYPMGDKDNWNWVFSPIIELSGEEQKEYPIPGKSGEYYESRLGVEPVDGMVLFGQHEYLEACKKIGITKDIEEQIE
jgi:DNA-directed RNA polymerase subunit RPC12/RpoP